MLFCTGHNHIWACPYSPLLTPVVVCLAHPCYTRLPATKATKCRAAAWEFFLWEILSHWPGLLTLTSRVKIVQKQRSAPKVKRKIESSPPGLNTPQQQQARRRRMRARTRRTPGFENYQCQSKGTNEKFKFG